jgi:hypothetical protein
MNANLTKILSAAGALALLATPSMAKQNDRNQTVGPADSVVAPSRAAAAPATAAAPPTSAQTLYSPNVPSSAEPVHGMHPDFQLSHE